MKLNYTLFSIVAFHLLSINLYGQCPEVVDAGTVTVNNDGGTDIPYVVCFGDPVDLTNNGDFILPTTGPSPALMFALYTCPPTELVDPALDPCYDSSFWTGSDFQTNNDGGIVDFLGQNTFWMVPIAADNNLPNPAGPNYDSNGDLCYDINIDQVVMFTFLDEILITETAIDDCLGEVTIEIEGGYAALFPGSYNVTNTGGGSLSQSGANGQFITISGLTDGDSYGFDLDNDGAGCTASFSGGPIDQNIPSISFDYPDICYEGSGFPDFASPSGGTFSFTSPPGDGASIDPSSGEITDALMDYDVTYTVMGDCMSFDQTITVTVLPPVPVPTINAFYEFCESDNATVTPNGVGDFFTLYENDFTQNSLWTGQDFDMADFVNPGDGPIDFYVSQNIGDCESEREIFSVEILSESPPNVPLFYTVCEGEQVTISPTSAHGNSSPSFNFYGDSGLTDFLFNGSEYIFTPSMNTVIYVTEYNSVCETRAASVDIFIEVPPTGIAGAPTCDITNVFYSVTITTDAANITSSEGMVTNNNDGTFTIGNIPSGTAPNLVLISSPNQCTSDLNLPMFECACQPPLSPVSDGDPRICVGEPFPTLSVTVEAGVTVDWYDTAMNGNLLLSNSNTYTPTLPGTYYAEARTIADDCINDVRTAVSFTIDPVPVVSMTSTDCSADLLSYNVQLQLIDAGSIQSSVGTVSGGPVNYTISGVPVGTDVTYTAFNSDMSCSIGPINVTSPNCPCPTIDPPIAGGDQMICEGDPIPTLNAVVGAGETVDWYDAPIAGNLLASGSLTYTPSSAGTYYIETRNLINNCVSSRVAISIVSNPLPTFSLSSSVCAIDLLTYQVDVAIMNADNLVVNSGTVMDLGGGNYSVSGITSGTNLELTLSNSITSCSAMFTITAPDCSCAPVAAPVSNGDIQICTGDVIPPLTVSVNAGETVDWYDAPTAGNLLLSNSSSYTPTGAGTFYAETRIIADDCISAIRTPVTLTIDTTPTLVLSAATCDANLLSYTLNLELNDATTLQVNAGNITNNGSGSFTIDNIPIGTDLIYTAFNATNTCSFGPETVVTLTCPCPMIAPPIVADTMICAGDPIPTISAIVEANETADWYDAPNAGNQLLSNSLNYTPTADGTYYVEARNTVNNCVSARVAITISTNPLPSIAIDNSTCSDDLLTYSVSFSTTNADMVSTTLGILVPDNIIPDTYTVSDIPVGMDLTINLENSLTTCMLTEIIPAPDCSCGVIDPPISDGNVSICTGDVIPALTVNVGAGQTVNWYDAPIDGNLLLSNSNSFTPLMAGFYFAETFVTADGCTSSDRTLVSLEINTTPSLIVAEANCAPNLQSYEISLQILNGFSIETNLGTVMNNGGGNFSIIDIPVGMDVNYTAFNIDSTCTIGPLMVVASDCSCPDLQPPSTSPDQSICEGEMILDMMVSVGLNQTADWYDAEMNGNLLSAENLTFSPITAGTYYVEARDTITNCISVRVPISLEINPIPSFIVNTNDCASDLMTYSVNITVNDADLVTSNLGDIIDTGGGQFTIENIPTAMDLTINLENTISGCTFSDMVLAPDCSCPVVDAPTALMDTMICVGENIPNLVAVVGPNETVDWYDAAVGGNLLLEDNPIFTPVMSGTYYAETRNTIHGCLSLTRSVVVFTINENPVLSVNNFSLPTCNQEDGVIELSTTSGTPPYNYSSNNGPFQLETTFNDLSANSYDILVEDANGCTDMVTQNLISPEDVFADAGDPMLLTCATTTVELDGSASDSGNDIVYQWLDPQGMPIIGANATTLEVQSAGTYSLVVTNSITLCSRTAEVLVSENITPPMIEAGEQQNLTCDTEIVVITATSGMINDLELNWSTSQGGNIIGAENTASITANATGFYHITATNPENACIASDSVQVTELLPEDLDFDIEVNSPACFGDTDGSISVQPTNPNATLLYSLEGGPYSPIALYTNLVPGSYSLSVQDENGCESDTLLTIQQGVDVQIVLDEELFISLGDSAFLDAMTNLGSSDIASINWTNGESLRCDTCLTTFTNNLQETTLFSLQLTDSLGCSASDEVLVYVNRERQIFVPSAFSPDESGANDQLVVFGGNDIQNIKSFTIFSRWGEAVFEKKNFMPNNPSEGWDGRFNETPLNAGIFVYVIEVEFIDGDTEVFSGDIMLLR